MLSSHVCPMVFPWFSHGFPTVSQALTDVPSGPARGAGPGAGCRPPDGRGQMGGTLRGATGTREALEDGAWDDYAKVVPEENP